MTASATIVTFTPFSLGVGESCTIMYDLECAEFDNVARVDTAIVVAWCEGLDPVEYETYAVTDTSYATVTCQGGEACPHTIGFWRQQCAQKLNGSTKVCLEGMYNLWRVRDRRDRRQPVEAQREWLREHGGEHGRSG